MEGIVQSRKCNPPPLFPDTPRVYMGRGINEIFEFSEVLRREIFGFLYYMYILNNAFPPNKISFREGMLCLAVPLLFIHARVKIFSKESQ